MSAMSNGLVLVDTSVWVRVLRGDLADPGVTGEVAKALQDSRAALCDPVWVELYRGVRGRKDLARLEGMRRLCQWLEFDADCWRLAAETARACREHGRPVPLGDILVFACARRHGAALLERDRHFAEIAAVADSRA